MNELAAHVTNNQTYLQQQLQVLNNNNNANNKTNTYDKNVVTIVGTTSVIPMATGSSSSSSGGIRNTNRDSGDDADMSSYGIGGGAGDGASWISQWSHRVLTRGLDRIERQFNVYIMWPLRIRLLSTALVAYEVYDNVIRPLRLAEMRAALRGVSFLSLGRVCSLFLFRFIFPPFFLCVCVYVCVCVCV